MSVSQPSLTVQAVAAAKNRAWLAPLLGLSTGVLGGAIQSKILSAPMSHSILLGGIFGLAFSLFFARRATTPGAGLIWGLGGGLLLWFVMPTGIDLLLLRSASIAMLNDAQARFPQLVAYLVCLGMPVGVVLGIRDRVGSRRLRTVTLPHHRTCRFQHPAVEPRSSLSVVGTRRLSLACPRSG